MRLLTAVSLVRVQLGELFYARKGRESSGRNEIDETCKIQMNVSCRFFATHEKPFVDLIRNAVENGHKILVFSQFTTMLSRLADRLENEETAYYVLTGSTGKEKRAKLVEEFNKEDNPTAVFLISLKAGGTGLNLTAADIVIHYDPWWNLAVQNQATDRAHRIGQKNIVNVYKLIAKDTIEENIVKLQEKKHALADQILSGEDMGSGSFSREEILELLGSK